MELYIHNVHYIRRWDVDEDFGSVQIPFLQDPKYRDEGERFLETGITDQHPMTSIPDMKSRNTIQELHNTCKFDKLATLENLQSSRRDGGAERMREARFKQQCNEQGRKVWENEPSESILPACKLEYPVIPITDKPLLLVTLEKTPAQPLPAADDIVKMFGWLDLKTNDSLDVAAECL